MENFQLSAHFQISGIGATSGLVLLENSLFLISDNSSFLYQYKTNTQELHKIKLSENSEENTIKKEKLDFESLTLSNNKLYIFGSGSTKKREKRFSYNLETQEIKQKDISKLYQKLKDYSSISDDDLNIEGTIINNNNYYFFQRGNGANCKNGILIYNKETEEMQFTTFHLPKINNIEATFTDAILVENKIYFLASAEDTTSTYNDGEVMGSLIGCIDFETLQLQETQIITEKIKFEGLTLLKKSESEIEFLLCEDNDTEVLETTIYKLKIGL